jgi:arylsulfatase A-like enzyme
MTPLHSLKVPLLIALLAGGIGSVLSAAARPNVLVLLVDDMGYGDPHCFNPASKIATPNIDKLASQGMSFTNAHAPASICVPSRYGLLTGRMPYRTWQSSRAKAQTRNGHTMLHFPAPMLQQEPERLNLASMLKRQGYATACIGKWHQGMSPSAQRDGTLKMSPVDFGFDYYFGFDAPEQGPYAFIENKRFVIAPTDTIKDHPGDDVTNVETQGAHWRKGLAAPGWKFEDILPTIASKADDWLAKHDASKPFFLYYAVPAPHAPWTPVEKFKGKSGAGQYGDYAMAVDAVVGRVMATLDKLKLREDTLVFFSSDNGPVWYPQDIEKFDHRAAGPWKGMKGDLTDAGHRMPFIASWPGKIRAGSSCDALICFTDLMATLASITGERLPADAGEDSLDLTPLLRGEKAAHPIRHGMVHVNYGSYNLAIREGDWKLILPEWAYALKDGTITPDRVINVDVKGPKAGFQLYDLRNDPSESTNVFTGEQGKANELFDLLKADLARGRSARLVE